MRLRLSIRDLLWLTLVVALAGAIRWYVAARPDLAITNVRSVPAQLRVGKAVQSTYTTGRPDLIITNVRFVPAEPRVGEAVQPIITYRNVGRKAAANVELHQSELIGAGWGGQSGELEPGEERDFLWGVVTVEHAGAFKFVFTIDPENTVKESNEDNNMFKVYLNVKDKDDEPESFPQ
jgi:subtilase family serine protease